jgi:hypothetical protein
MRPREQHQAWQRNVEHAARNTVVQQQRRIFDEPPTMN